MKEPMLCPRCGVQLPGGTPPEECPRCLMSLALSPGEGSDPGEVIVTRYGDAAPPPDPAELAPHFPNLEIIEVVGQGGMGVVYKARQKGLDRMVALKILAVSDRETAFPERFAREARALASLNHPNIVSVYDSGEAGGHYFLIMEFVEGANLRQMIRAKAPSPAEALELVEQICTALQFAHDEGVVHRDIKPENILVDARGRVKIADFGLAKLLGRAPEAALTRPTQAMGTPHYMAPEQIERPLEVDHRADIYSLGVVFYELLTGELPLGRFQPPSSKISVDVRIDDVVLRTLEKEPERRYQRAGDVKTDVETISGTGGGGVPIRAGSPGSAPTSGPAPSLALWPWFAGGGVLLFLALAVLASTLIFRGEEASIRESTLVAVSILGLLLLAFLATIVGIVRSLLNARQGATGPWPWVLGFLLLLLIPAGLGFFVLVGSAVFLAGARVEPVPVTLSGTAEDHSDHTLFCDLVEEAKSLGLAAERHARFREVVVRPELSEHEQMHFADAVLVSEDGEQVSDTLAELLRYRDPAVGLTSLVIRRAGEEEDGGAAWLAALETEREALPSLAEDQHTPVCGRIEGSRIYSTSSDSLRHLRTIARYPRLTDHERFHLIDRMFAGGFSSDLADSAIVLIESGPLSEAVRARLREEALGLSFAPDRERILRALEGYREEPRQAGPRSN